MNDVEKRRGEKMAERTMGINRNGVESFFVMNGMDSEPPRPACRTVYETLLILKITLNTQSFDGPTFVLPTTF